MPTSERATARLILEDGSVYDGLSIGAQGTTFGELVFNTALTGYQEILTDPSYKGQVVLMTYPEIGNYGVNDEDVESQGCHAAGFIVRRLSRTESNWRSNNSLNDLLKRQNIIGIEGVDTRAITRKIRALGSPKTAITTESKPVEILLQQIQSQPDFVEQDFVSKVSTPELYIIRNELESARLGRMVVLDFGIKQSILDQLSMLVSELIVVPNTTRTQQIIGFKPDAVFFSNGPGDPNALPHAVQRAKDLMAHDIPLFGICLGHQILTLACGGRVIKMPFGHHGGNHPVKDLLRDEIIITAQNHSYAAAIDGFPSAILDVTHINLNDQTIEGFKHKTLPVVGIQFHPEAGPGPHDAHYLFGVFFDSIASKQLAWA